MANENNYNQLLSKAMKLLNSSERGDIQIRPLAKEKYDSFIFENLIDHNDVIEYRKKTENPNINERPGKFKTPLTFLGRTFNYIDDFKKWYSELSFIDKMKVAAELGMKVFDKKDNNKKTDQFFYDENTNSNDPEQYFFNQKP